MRIRLLLGFTCKHGELGELLRSEKLYSAQFKLGGASEQNTVGMGYQKSRPGPAAKHTPEQKRIHALEQQVSRLEGKLNVANECISLQKKVSSILDHMNSEPLQ